VLGGVELKIGGFHSFKVVSFITLLSFFVSLGFGSAKTYAIESKAGAARSLSSPEDDLLDDSDSLALDSSYSFVNGLMGPQGVVGALPSSLQFQSAQQAARGGNSQSSSLLIEGVFPYQANPIAAVVAAGLTLAAMSLKETGRVDLNGILFLLNSSDFYAGLIGTMSASTGQKGGVAVSKYLGRAAGKVAPKMIKPLAQNQALQVMGNIINGFTHTLSVSGGYEYFSQFWMVATKSIPEAHTVTGFFKADWATQKRVLLNLAYVSMIDKELQKRILDSVRYHRIETFEFIAMNVGIYVGAQLGSLAARQWAPGNPWARQIGPVAGSVGLGILVQAMPDSWKEYFNAKLIENKIRRVQRKYDRLQETIRAGIKDFYYPSYDVDGMTSYVSSGIDLRRDLDRLVRARHLLSSFRLQKAFASPQASQLWSDVADLHQESLSFLQEVRDNVGEAPPSIEERIHQWLYQGRSPLEIQKLKSNLSTSDSKSKHYRVHLEAAVTEAEGAQADWALLMQAVESNEAGYTPEEYSGSRIEE
jgi:hypothetical protein